MRIGKRSTGERDAVDLSVRKRLFAHIRIIHVACNEHGNFDCRLDFFRKRYIIAFGHIVRRNAVVERIVGAGVAVEHIVAVLLEQTCDLHRFLDRSADLVFSEERGFVEAFHIGLHAEAYGHGVIRAAGFLDAFDDHSCAAESVFKAAAELVGALVRELHCELIEDVAPVHAVNLDAVEAAGLGKLCELDHAVDLCFNVFAGHLACFDAGIFPARKDGRCLLVQTHAAVTHGHLHEYLAAVSMDALHHFDCVLPEGTGSVVGAYRAVYRVGRIHHCCAERYKAEAALCFLNDCVNTVDAVFAFRSEQNVSAAHGADGVSVFDFYFPDLERAE